jgi:hypothetical protein
MNYVVITFALVDVSFLVSRTLAADFLTSSLRLVVFFVDRNMFLSAAHTHSHGRTTSAPMQSIDT